MTRGHKVLAAACALAATAPAGARRWRRRAPACSNRAARRSGSASPTPATRPTSGSSSDAAQQAPGGDPESFRTWGSDFPESIQRWQTARARPMLHITTADNNDGHELDHARGRSPRASGDEYLIRLNRLFHEKEMRAYVRPLGEPNRCLNVYAAYDCAGARPRRRPQAALVQARLPPHLRDRPRRRQGEDRSTAASPKPACRR